MSKRARPVATKTTAWKKKKVVKKDDLSRWALEPGFKMNLKRADQNVSVNVTNVTSTSASLLNTIAQGVGDNMRVGQRVRYFNWTVRGVLQFDPAATGVMQSDYVRILFFYDRQTNTTAPTFADVITNISGGTHAPYDPINWYQRGRFKIIRDFQIPLGPMSATVTLGVISATQPAIPPFPTSQEMNIHFFKALKGKIDTEWNGTGSGVGNINGGGFFFVCQNVQGTGFTILTVSSSMEFTDV